MATVAQLITGLETRLATIEGLRVTGFHADKVSVPAGAVGLPDSIDYDTTMARGIDSYVFTIRIYVTRAEDRNSQATLGTYLSPTGAMSVKAAVEGDRTLGCTGTDCRVSDAGGIGVYEVGGQNYAGAELIVRVTTPGV